jgi:hypothetical protein
MQPLGWGLDLSRDEPVFRGRIAHRSSRETPRGDYDRLPVGDSLQG